MHYHAEVWLPKDTENVRETVEDIMAPYQEEHSNNGFWDWYSIGGRWTGVHDGYDASQDIRNYAICNMCYGTGIRTDLVEKTGEVHAKACRGCNSCSGRGVRREWDNTPHPGDIMELDKVKDSMSCFMLLVYKDEETEIVKFKDFTYLLGEQSGESVKKYLKDNFDIIDGYLVTVDYHS